MSKSKKNKRKLYQRKWEEVKSNLRSLFLNPLLGGEKEEFLKIKGFLVKLTRVK